MINYRSLISIITVTSFTRTILTNINFIFIYANSYVQMPPINNFL